MRHDVAGAGTLTSTEACILESVTRTGLGFSQRFLSILHALRALSHRGLSEEKRFIYKGSWLQISGEIAMMHSPSATMLVQWIYAHPIGSQSSNPV
jgi:hypothetical protein